MGQEDNMRLTLLLLCLLIIVSGCGQSDKNVVVVYVSEDQVFSQPILKDFERDTEHKSAGDL